MLPHLDDETTKEAFTWAPLYPTSMVGFPGFSLLDTSASACFFLPGPFLIPFAFAETGVALQLSNVALECSRSPGAKERHYRSFERRWLFVWSSICIPTGQPVSHSVIERAGCYVKSDRYPLRCGLSPVNSTVSHRLHHPSTQ